MEGLLAFRNSSLRYTGILEENMASNLNMYTDPVRIDGAIRKPAREAAVEAIDREIDQAVGTERQERLKQLRNAFD